MLVINTCLTGLISYTYLTGLIINTFLTGFIINTYLTWLIKYLIKFSLYLYYAHYGNEFHWLYWIHLYIVSNAYIVLWAWMYVSWLSCAWLSYSLIQLCIDPAVPTGGAACPGKGSWRRGWRRQSAALTTSWKSWRRHALAGATMAYWLWAGGLHTGPGQVGCIRLHTSRWHLWSTSWPVVYFHIEYHINMWVNGRIESVLNDTAQIGIRLN